MIVKTDDKYYKEIAKAIGKKKKENRGYFPSQMAAEILSIKDAIEYDDADTTSYPTNYFPRATGEPFNAQKFHNKFKEGYSGKILFSNEPAPPDALKEQNILNGENINNATVFFKETFIKENQPETATIYSKNGGGVFAPVAPYIPGNLPLSLFQNIKNIDFTYLDTSKSNSMSSMFATCSTLVSLDLSHFNTSKVTDMKQMFFACEKLAFLDISNFTFDAMPDINEISMFEYVPPSAHIICPTGWYREGNLLKKEVKQ